MDSSFSPLDVSPGTSGMEPEDNTAWYSRWYVWVLPILVLGGVIYAVISQ